MAKVTMKSAAGKAAASVELPDAMFGIVPNISVMHQVVLAQLAHRRAGTQSTKGRAQVRGGGRKPFAQKGTGNARQGSIRAPHFAGGAVALGPTPRKYSQRTPKKMVQLALRSALSDRAADGKVIVVDSWSFDKPNAKSAAAALAAGAVGVGLFRSEFLFMGRAGNLPGEEEQYQAYRRAVEGMQGLPVTIRTVDIGADKPLDRNVRETAHLNPALGLRAIRWSLADPAMFLTQLRAILRAAVHGQVQLLIPMLAHGKEIRQTLALLARARAQLDGQGVAYGPLKIGAMIEIPAAALTVPMFLSYFDFLSIGTNDLIQYTLAIDRADEQVADLYDPLHPAILHLVANTIAQGLAQDKTISVCGEMAGDPSLTRLLLGMGLRSFSMHPTQILAVKQVVLRSDTSRLKPWAQRVLESDNPAELLASG